MNRVLILICILGVVGAVSFYLYSSQSLRDYTKDTSSTCRIHGEQMTAVVMDARCGSTGEPVVSDSAEGLSYFEAKRKYFPNYQDRPLDVGHCFGAEQQRIRRARIFECKQCAAAREEWVQSPR